MSQESTNRIKYGEATLLLAMIASGRAKVFLSDESEPWDTWGPITFDVEGYKLTVFVDAGDLDYIEKIVSPRGEVGGDGVGYDRTGLGLPSEEFPCDPKFYLKTELQNLLQENLKKATYKMYKITWSRKNDKFRTTFIIVSGARALFDAYHVITGYGREDGASPIDIKVTNLDGDEIDMSKGMAHAASYGSV